MTTALAIRNSDPMLAGPVAAARGADRLRTESCPMESLPLHPKLVHLPLALACVLGCKAS